MGQVNIFTRPIFIRPIFTWPIALSNGTSAIVSHLWRSMRYNGGCPIRQSNGLSENGPSENRWSENGSGENGPSENDIKWQV